MTNIEHGDLTLAQLGWRPFFQQQLVLEQWEYPVVRVIEQYRNRLDLLGDLMGDPDRVPCPPLALVAAFDHPEEDVVPRAVWVEV